MKTTAEGTIDSRLGPYGALLLRIALGSMWDLARSAEDTGLYLAGSRQVL
jgi:hypothetical protein